jgi:hypothetical protein
MPLITLEQANDHLRLDLERGGSPEEFIDDRTPAVQLALDLAEASILNYLEVEGDPDASSPPLWAEPDRRTVQAAVLYMLKAIYDNAGDDAAERYLKPGGTIVLLLARIREPAVA